MATGGLTVEQLEFLAAKGLALEDVIAFAKMSEKPKSKGAERTARWRARKAGVTSSVTSDVTRDASPPPIDNNHTPPVSSDDETSRARKTKHSLGKPEGVAEQVWVDFLAHRKAKRAPVSETVIAGIRREAEKAGWSLEDALAEIVARGWQGFKAEWVSGARAPPAEPVSLVDHILARQKATAP